MWNDYWPQLLALRVIQRRNMNVIQMVSDSDNRGMDGLKALYIVEEKLKIGQARTCNAPTPCKY